MAELAGLFAVSHAPPIVRAWDKVCATSKLEDAFLDLGQRIAATRPDVLLMIGADHWTNFFLDNMPAICLGVGDEHDGPPEQWLSDYPHRDMAGHAEFAMHLARTLFAGGIEPSLSYRMKLDHAFCVPLWKAGLDPLPPIVPVVINALQEPLPTMARCLEFGEVVRRAIMTMDASLRVTVLATGGLSHSVGEPTMGRIDEDFDREVLALLADGNARLLLDFLTDARVAAAGNGAAELRFWLAAHGIADKRGFELLHYEPVAATYTGCGFGQWKI